MSAITTNRKANGKLNAVLLAVHIALLVVSFATLVVVGAQAQGFHPSSVGAMTFGLVIAAFAATRLRALGNIMHECSHDIFVSTTHNNRTIGKLIALFLGQDFQTYKSDHLSHHRFLGQPKKDQDLQRYGSDLYSFAESPHFFTYITKALSARLFLKALPSLNLSKPIKNIRFITPALFFWTLHTALFTFLLVVSGPAGAALHALTVFFFYPVLCAFSDFADHGMSESQKENKSLKSRNHIFQSQILNLLFFPRNDAYHLIHHMYPRLPVSAYTQVHRQLCESNSSYNAMEHKLPVALFK